MNKKFLTLICIFVCIPLIFFGCKTTPEAEDADTQTSEVAPLEAELTDEEALVYAQDEIESAKKNKARIEGLEFISYDSASYEAGCKLLAEYEEKAESLSAKDRLALAKQTNDAFKAVLSLGFADLSVKKKAEVDPVRDNCIAAGAEKSSPSPFASAEFLYRLGNEYGAEKKYEMSYDSFSKALISYTELYQGIFDKKAKAAEAVEKAKKRTNEVEQFALEADKICPLLDESVKTE